jgi:hypothetical protein
LNPSNPAGSSTGIAGALSFVTKCLPSKEAICGIDELARLAAAVTSRGLLAFATKPDQTADSEQRQLESWFCIFRRLMRRLCVDYYVHTGIIQSIAKVASLLLLLLLLHQCPAAIGRYVPSVACTHT